MHRAEPSPARLDRLAAEVAEEGLPTSDALLPRRLLLELDYALRPQVFEQRIPSYGALVDPSTDPSGWEEATTLAITRQSVSDLPVDQLRFFADGLASWVVTADDAPAELLVFDRPAGSERDLVIVAETMGADIVQRHPSGMVRLVGAHGVLRWDGMTWHHEPPVRSWIDTMGACTIGGDHHVLELLLEFAVHDLGARGIGALLIYRPLDGPLGGLESRLADPPPLRITEPTDLTPLRHMLGQVDGAAVFDADGTLVELGARLVPTSEAEAAVDGYRGMRHTAARRFSYDDRASTVIAVSEDGPVTVLREGELQGRSEPA